MCVKVLMLVSSLPRVDWQARSITNELLVTMPDEGTLCCALSVLTIKVTWDAWRSLLEDARGPRVRLSTQENAKLAQISHISCQTSTLYPDNLYVRFTIG